MYPIIFLQGFEQMGLWLVEKQVHQQIDDWMVTAPEFLEETDMVVRMAPHGRVQQRTVGAPMPQIWEETVESGEGRRAIAIP